MARLTKDELIQFRAIQVRLSKAVEDGTEYHDGTNGKDYAPYKSRRDIAVLVNIVRKLMRGRTRKCGS